MQFFTLCLAMDSFTYRQDVRTVEETAADLLRTTTAEQHWGVALEYEFCARLGQCTVEEYGVDNTGKLIMGKLPNRNADKKYVFTEGDSLRVEICGHRLATYHTTLSKATFKVDKIERLLEQDCVDVIVMPILDVYYVIGVDAAKHMLDKLNPMVGDVSWGYKSVLQINRTNLSGRLPTSLDEMRAAGLIDVHTWTPQAQAYIAEHADVLYAARTGAWNG